MRRLSSFLLVAVGITLLICDVAGAQDAKTPGWYFDADLASVTTGGNSQSSTLGVGGKLRRLWTRSRLTFTGSATQTKSTLISRFAMGTSDNYQVTEEKTTKTTAELYFLRGAYAYDISKRFFTFGGMDWLRNIFAGIDSRFLIAIGAGNTWSDTESVSFSTNYSATYTFEENVIENPFVKSEFPGLRFGYDLDWKLTESTLFDSMLFLDWNLDNTDDVRIDWYNALPISISKKLSFTPSLQLLWRNDPALTTVPLFDTGGSDTGETVPTPLKKLDTVFTMALVVKLGPEQP